jgi:hypothetical protein
MTFAIPDETPKYANTEFLENSFYIYFFYSFHSR